MTTDPADNDATVDTLFTIGAGEFDTCSIVAQIKAKVAVNMEQGVYSDINVARAERMNLANLRNEDDLFGFYMDCLRDSCFVDINDFEIIERRTGPGKLLRILKKVIWKLLKFYTYRLWSQQNQVNGLLMSTIELSENRHSDKIAQLEKRISELESPHRSS